MCHAHFITSRAPEPIREGNLCTALWWPVSARVSTEAARSRRQLHSVSEASCSVYIRTTTRRKAEHPGTGPEPSRLPLLIQIWNFVLFQLLFHIDVMPQVS
ncbi:hypothetical protein AMELA_G00220330 [Ameiurus melas]|uniref:Uncharacterized protein n=1 Tax=Ameiurus melas TaxID=219545 RepID=A0A7J6A1Z9_AMEME|nr:hypothetical protein AMELA_G00220330 [Ameiurus melas]